MDAQVFLLSSYLEELHKEFPGATVVWTHRDPAECIASACSLYETIMRFCMEEISIDPKALGAAVVRLMSCRIEPFVREEKKRQTTN